jgi:HEAT repeat protein
MFQHVVAACAVVILLPMAVYPAPRPGFPPQGGWGVKDADLSVLLEELYATDDIPARTAILRAGPVAAPGLLALLQDLADHKDEPHFVKGREQELRQYLGDPAGNSKLAAEYDITGRLIDDCIVLLGHLRSGRAAPVILKLLEAEPVGTGEPKCLLETRALEEIGEPAVLPLIDALRNAGKIAASIPHGNVRAIRARISLALMDIADPRAIPALEDLIKRGGEFKGDRSIKSAIDEMRLKQK